jgi:DNA-binding transcriptional LysR family regulator
VLKDQTDSARLVWIDAFMAAAAYDSDTEAGEMTGRAGTTIRRQVEELEEWLHRVLVTLWPRELTEDGDRVVETASKILELVDRGGLRAEIGRTRVQANGLTTIEGRVIRTAEAMEIANLLTRSRAVIDRNYVAPPPVDPNDIDMAAFFADRGE